MLHRSSLGLAAAVLSIFVIGATANAHDLRVKVSAGKTALRNTPVSIDIDNRDSDHVVATIERNGKTSAGQIVALGKQGVRVWWLVDDLDAGASAVYEIELGTGESTSDQKHFSWKTSSGDHGTSNDLVVGDRPVLRYMHTKFELEKKELTKKPFHHVFATDGSRLITKGAGGLYPHHRGIYFGYNKCKVGGQSYDTWHAHKGEHQVHVKERTRIEGPIVGGHTVEISWNDRAGKPFIAETRTLLVFRQPQGQHLIEFASTLTATGGTVMLDGDPQHAGVQFRAAQYVADHQKTTRYLRAEKWKDLPENKQINWPQNKQHRDMPWNAVRFKIEAQDYTVAYLSHPNNPDDARSSERLYGRFGEFFPYKLEKGKELSVLYRWWISNTHDTMRGDVEQRYQHFASPPKIEILE
jgi:hypothetical protein